MPDCRLEVRGHDAGGVTVRPNGTQSNLALSNLRALVILVVLAFHSVLAYLGSLGPSAFPFDASPYQWRAFPIVDGSRWFGFDIFCAWQDVYLMSLMFFLSALFTWPSLSRKGSRKFLGDRLLRLGVPFAFALLVVMPIALYPVYLTTAVDPGLVSYARHYLALPFWPNGPMWFLWQLLALTMVAAALHRYAAGWGERLGQWSSTAATRPGRFFAGLVVASTFAYVPLALLFTPWSWSERGPFALQFSRPLLYAAFYFAGLSVGANGLERGLLAPEGLLARRWGTWLGGALAAFVAWMGLTALTMFRAAPAPLALQAVVDFSFVVACATSCLFVMAGCLRFGTRRSRIFDSIANNAFGMYLLHYAFVVWLQYALLGVALLAIAKAGIVFAGTALLAWTATVALNAVPFGSRLIGAERRRPASLPSSRRALPGTDAYPNDPYPAGVATPARWRPAPVRPDRRR